MDLLVSYEDGENSGTNSPLLKKDEHKPMSPNASLQAEWESFEKMIGGGGSDDSSTDVIPVSTDQYLVGGIVAYPGMMQVKHGNQEYSGENTNSSPERKKGRSLADDVMKLLGSSNLTEELDMPPRKRSHSSDSSRSSSSDGSESRSPSVSPERGTNDKERTPDLVKDRLTEEVPDDRSSRKRTISNTSASADEKPSTDLEKQDRSPTRRKRSSSRSPNRRKRSRSSRSRNRSGSRTRKRSRDRKRSPRRSRERRHKKDRRSSRDRHKRRGKDGKRRSRSRERHHKRSHRRSRSRSPRHKHKRSRSHSRNRDRPHRSRSRSRDKSHRSRSRSRDRSHRSRSRSRDRSHRSDHSRAGPSRDEGEKHLTFKEKMRQQLLKASKYLQAGESLEGIDEVPKEKPSKLPLNDKSFFAAMAASTASGVTPQMALIQTMAAMHQKAQEMTGVAVPKYYNPAAVNPLKYAEQVQKRKLLWSKSRDTKKDEKEKEWENTAFISDQNGKVAAKFRKLMGIKHDEQEEEEGAPELTDEQKKKQEEMFCRLDKEYEFARMTTHTHRGVGLGFSSQGFSAT